MDGDSTRVWNSVSYICLNASRDKLLILKRAFDDDSEPGKWCLAGGGVDAGESFEESLFREVLEETGCEVAEYDYFKSIVVGSKLRVIFFFGNIVDESKLKMNHEHSEFKWVGFDEFDRYDFAFNHGDVIDEFLDVMGEDLEDNS
jgi:8-oxo-dGTP pyrophosphatase MutT (NUDIX family)